MDLYAYQDIKESQEQLTKSCIRLLSMIELLEERIKRIEEDTTLKERVIMVEEAIQDLGDGVKSSSECDDKTTLVEETNNVVEEQVSPEAPSSCEKEVSLSSEKEETPTTKNVIQSSKKKYTAINRPGTYGYYIIYIVRCKPGGITKSSLKKECERMFLEARKKFNQGSYNSALRNNLITYGMIREKRGIIYPT